MRLNIKYGNGSLAFDVPDENIGEVIRAQDYSPAEDGRARLAEALEPRLRRAVGDFAGRDVLVLMADGTRDQPHCTAYAALAPLLAEARTVRILIATGTHKADTPDDRRIADELRRASAELHIPLNGVDTHDCRDSAVYYAGTTSFGNRVELNRSVRSADTIVIVSDMKPHFFAGYSNAVKFLLPGVAAFDCIERNHALALDPLARHCRHPLHPDPARRRNPLAEDQLEAARFVTARKPVYALVTVGSGACVNWATFGALEPAVTEGIRFVDSHLVRTVTRQYACAVIGCGGYPNDETLYIAQRSLELTKEAVADGAAVLWLAECRNGIASSQQAVDNFFTPLKRDPAAFADRVRRKYIMFSHKAVKFVEMMRRLKSLRVVSALPPGTFPAGGMEACTAPQDQVAEWVARGERILFVDDANKLAVTLRTAAARPE